MASLPYVLPNGVFVHALHRSQSLAFWINSLDDIHKSQGLRPSSIISFSLPLPLLSLFFPSDTMTFFSICTSNDVCLYLIVVYNIPTSLALSRQSVIYCGSPRYSHLSSQKPHLHCHQVIPNMFVYILKSHFTLNLLVA